MQQARHWNANDIGTRVRSAHTHTHTCTTTQPASRVRTQTCPGGKVVPNHAVMGPEYTSSPSRCPALTHCSVCATTLRGSGGLQCTSTTAPDRPCLPCTATQQWEERRADQNHRATTRRDADRRWHTAAQLPNRASTQLNLRTPQGTRTPRALHSSQTPSTTRHDDRTDRSTFSR